MFDAEGAGAVAGDGAEPGQGLGVAVDDGDEAGVGSERRQQALDVGAGADAAGLAGAFGGVPAGVQAVGRGNGEQAGAGHVLEQLVVGGDRLGRDRAGVDDGQFGPRRRRPQPVAAQDDVALARLIERARGLVERPRRQAEIDRAALDVAQPVGLGLSDMVKVLEDWEASRGAS